MEYIRTIDLEPNISLDDILNFINFYINKNLWEWYINFDDWIEFKSKYSINLFHTLLLLHLESVITLTIKWQLNNEYWKINKTLEKNISKHKNNPWIIWKIFWISWGFNMLSLQNDWINISKDIKYLDCIEYNIKISSNLLFTLLFCKITEYIWYKNIDRERIGEELYEFFYEQTWWKNNYLWEITLFYEFFNDYLKNQRLVWAILIELEKKNKLFISKVFIKDTYVYFKIKKITNLSKELFIETSKIIKDNWKGEKEKIDKIEYTKKWVKINWNIWIPKDSKKSEIFLYILSNYFLKNNESNKISIVEINNFYIENIDKFLFNIEKSKRVKYLKLTEDNIKNSYLKTISKKIKEEYIEDLLEIKRWHIISKKT